MKNFKKYVGLLGVFSLLLTSGFGCNDNLKPAPKPISLELWTVNDDAKVITSLLATYRASRQYINVTVKQIPASDVAQKFLEALADDKGPDIISVNNRELGAYLSRLQPMPASIHDTQVYVTQGTMSNSTKIVESNKTMVTLDQLARDYPKVVKDDVVRGGKIYGLPLSLDVMSLYYNKDLLDRAGIAEPPKTWEDFQNDVKILTKFDKASGKILQAGAALGTGENIPGASDLLYILFTQSKITFNDTAGKAVFNKIPQGFNRSEETPAASVVNFYTDFANATRDTYTWSDSMDNARDAFANGSLAFFFGYSYDFKTIKSRAPQLNFDVLPMLQLSDGSPINIANYWIEAVPLRSKHANEAWGVVDYLTHSSATKQYLDATGRPTALRAYITEQSKDPKLQPFVSQVLTASNWYRGKNFAAADDAIKNIFVEWMKPVVDENRILEQHVNILNRAADKINQTL